MFLGIDSSTQSLTGLLIDPATGQIVQQTSVNFGSELPQFGSPSGFIPGGKDGEVHGDPQMWLEALDLMLTRLSAVADLSKVVAIAGSGQQHGSVYLDATFTDRLASLDAARTLSGQLSPAFSRATSPIWMDTSTGAECAEITAAAGGGDEGDEHLGRGERPMQPDESLFARVARVE
jgi:xylulokinase